MRALKALLAVAVLGLAGASSSLAHPDGIAPAHVTGRSEFATGGSGGDATATVGGAPLAATGGAVPAAVQAAWVVAENRRPGTDQWRITDAGKDGDIEGFADTVSAQQGDRVNLYVSQGKGSTYRVEAYRMGFYGGLGARLVWRSGPLPGRRQSKAHRESGTNMVEAPWDPTVAIDITRDWPPGDYLLKLHAESGPQRWVPLTVRDDASRAALVIMNAVTTWQAYNQWGGYSLYTGPRSYNDRARVVSFDRPYALGSGASDFPGNEFPLVSFAESLGLDVTYLTNVDLHARPDLLLHHKALISLGHDEYWSTGMRAAATTARDNGVNLAFLGANALFRKIRFVASPLGPDRREVAYKSAAEDPLRKTNRAEVTVNWRDAPSDQPESELIGQEYECNPVRADMVVADASSWVWEGTGVTDGQRLHDVIGSEYDRYLPRQVGPHNVALLAHSPVKCGGNRSFSDMTYYSAPSGAGVFATGTNWWISKLSTPCIDGSCPHDDVVVRVTANVLSAFALGPAGLRRPSTATDLSRLPVPASGAADTSTTSLRRRTTKTVAPTKSSTTKASSPTSTRPPPSRVLPPVTGP
ncbi:MAG: hypothetical protein JWO37_3899 [Acidimicrobiales bacterium]|nr:hypothetical protein [Acidimicrobiales bacterium]